MGADFNEADLRKSSFIGSDLTNSKFDKANLCEADFSETILRFSSFQETDLRKAKLSRSILEGSIFFRTDLRDASMKDTDFSACCLISTNLSNTNLKNSYIYGISVWDIETNNKTVMKDLVISRDPLITIDDIELAQFIYLILNNKKISNLITTMRTKSVLILGSFSDKSKSVLERLKKVLSNKNLIPIIFDFKPSEKQDSMETVRTIALLSNFVIVDLSIPAGQLHELASIVRNTYIPFATIVNDDSKQTSMLNEFRHQYWFKSDYFKYSLKDWQEQIPILFKNEIFPWVEKINKKLKEERTGI